MKNKIKLIGIILITIIVSALTACAAPCNCVACDGHDCKYAPELPSNQSDVINLFEGITANISGNLTRAQWSYAVPAIERRLVAAYNMGNTSAKNVYKDAFEVGITIIVEAGPKNYNYNLIGRTLHIHIDGINNLNATEINKIVLGIVNGNDVTAKAAPQVTPQLNKQVIAFESQIEKKYEIIINNMSLT